MKPVFDLLQGLNGHWKGNGQGSFPAIDAFNYVETLQFEACAESESFHYQQRTWLIDEQGKRLRQSHWEVGFLMVQADGRLVMHNAQNGRVEVLKGQAHSEGNTLVIDMASTCFGGDARMKGAHRVFRLQGDRLSYQITMQTTRTIGLVHHIEAVLQKTG